MLSRAVARKRLYPTLDSIISDSALGDAIRKDPSVGSINGPLSVAGCLLSEAPEPFPPIPTLRALEENLAVLDRSGAIVRRGSLARNLLNRDQFLHTISELALARTFFEQGWQICLEKRFYDQRDADIYAKRGDEERFIEVTNLASDPLPVREVYPGAVGPISDRDRVVSKIVEKFRQKFESPLNQGWRGRAWIALDIAKNDGENIHAVVQTLCRPTWGAELGILVSTECANLSGIVLYRSHPTATTVDIVVEQSLTCAGSQ